MSADFFDRISKLSPKRLALLALELHEQVEAADRRQRAPIAVIGMGCRFPGADDPAGFWTLLSEGRDAIAPVPRDRWDIDAYFDRDPDVPGRMSVRHGGFLDRVDGFDPAFFGITPREALTMDPQQRLLLEVAWEALEHAGLAPDRLAGSSTGVFVGICNSDHFQRLLQRGDAAIDAYVASGSAHSVAAGRIAYVLGLQGPALSIDTACSSSLVALHAACQSLRRGESSLALCGGVNIMCSPETTIALTKAHMLAPDGRCKTFDARADGFSRGEGCGVLVLKRLDTALADGDRVLAVIRGAAVNQDGRSGGLTVPNGPAQESVIRAALADAGVAPAEVAYVEAHGTGTSLGDPIEVRALAGAYGSGRAANAPLWIGSVKTNIGHLESAAGIAGVMKVILALQYERVPPHLHFTTPSPHIDWARYQVEVTSKGRDWTRGAARRLAGVSSFGFSGTNAHVVIEEAPLRAPEAATPRPWQCLPISARSNDAVKRLAGAYARTLDDGATIADVAHTAGVGRAQLTERVAIVARDAVQAQEALRAHASGLPHADVHCGSVAPGRTRDVVFLFTGQGAQYPGMARALYDAAPVFRRVIDHCDALLGPDADGRTLNSVLWSDTGEHSPIHQTAWTQPALFAVEYGLTELWRSWGIQPAAVMGHSVGEYVAACVAGVFSLEDGLRLIAERGRLMQALPPGGSMAAIFAPVADVAAAVAPWASSLAIAAINADDSVVISGASASVDAVLDAFERRNVKGHRLFVSLAAHSPLVEPALDAMEACARRVPMKAPQIPIVWNLTGSTTLPGGAPDATYWRRHLREPVRFAEGLRALQRDGYTTFLEVGPHPTLLALAERSLSADTTLLLTSLRRGKDDWHELMSSVAALFVHGASVNFAALDAPYASRLVDLPTYPFERRSYWVTPQEPHLRQTRPSVRATHPLLGARLATATPIFELVLTPAEPSYLDEHRVYGATLAAGPVYLEMVQACAREQFGATALAIEHFAIHKPLVLGDEGRTVQVHFTTGGDDSTPTAFSVYSREQSSTDWQLHATGGLVLQIAAHDRLDEPRGLPSAEPQPCRDYYERLAGLGIELGESFQSLRAVHREPSGIVARVELPAPRHADPVAWAHPALLDGALQAIGLALPGNDRSEVYLFAGLRRVAVTGALPTTLFCEVRLRDADDPQPREWTADVVLRDSDGTPRGEIRGVCLRRATRDTLKHVAGAGRDLFYSVEWEPIPQGARAAAVLADAASLAASAADQFQSLATQHGLSIYDELLPALDRVSVGYIVRALLALGFDATPGRQFTLESESRRLRVAERHGRLFARLVEMLIEDSLCRRRDDSVEVIAPFPAAAASADLGTAQLFDEVDGEWSTLQRCGPSLPRVLTGDQDPLQLLFPGGSLAEARKLYVDSPYAKTYNTLLAEAVQRALANVPAGTRVRVLEIGAGTGGTTTYVLPLVADRCVEYMFTDLSPHFLDRAAEQFAAYPFMRRAVLDIERGPPAQGFEAGGYDIIIAANVLHATADLGRTLTHVRQLLAPSGLLFLLEGVAPERWVDLTFGLTDGWWRFTDTARRGNYPLLDRAQWSALLTEQGFTGVSAIPAAASTSRAERQQALMIARAPARETRWLVLGADDSVGAAVVDRLRQRGAAVVTLPADAVDAVADAQADVIVYLGALPLAARMSDDLDAAGACRELACEVPLRALAAIARADASSRVWLVTKGAFAVDGAAASGSRWQAPLWGAGRVFALEHPSRWGGLIDLAPNDSDDRLAATLVDAIEGDGAEDQTAWRGGRRFAARLTPTPAPARDALRLRANRTYLVTGGFGGLGSLVARWLGERGATHIALLGRTPDPSAAAIRDLESRGIRVWALAGDVGDRTGMQRVLDRLADEAPPLAGILHAAADLTAAPIVDLQPAQVERMLRPKLDGTLVLESLTRDRALDFVVYFSSTTALIGASGFAHYAAANLFLDATAAASNRADRRVLSVNWGTWEAMRLASAERQRSFREGGLQPMTASTALDALAATLRSGHAQMAIADIDWGVLKPLHEARRSRPFLSRVGTSESSRVEAASADRASLVDRLLGVPADAQHEIVLSFVATEVASVLGLPSGEPVQEELGLFELGMDSLMSVELKRRLERGVGQPLPSTLTFNYPSVQALTGFIVSQLQPSAMPAASDSIASPSSQGALVGSEAELDELSDAEIEARLLARLEQAR